MKRSFLCVDDYGQGGIWYLVLADSGEQIKNKLLSLTGVESRPQWMDDARFERIREQRTLDIDNLPKDGILDLAIRTHLASGEPDVPTVSNEDAAELIN